MKLNACFENSGVGDVFFQIPYAIEAAKRNLDIHRIYYLDNGKLSIRKNSKAFRLYIKRRDSLFKLRENCADSFHEMFISLYAYVIFTEQQGEEYDFSQQLEIFSRLFREYQKKTIRALKELETFREFKFDSTLKEELFSLEFGKIKTREKMDELSTNFYKELFDQK